MKFTYRNHYNNVHLLTDIAIVVLIPSSWAASFEQTGPQLVAYLLGHTELARPTADIARWRLSA